MQMIKIVFTISFLFLAFFLKAQTDTARVKSDTTKSVIPETPPEFPGGDSGLYQFLSSHLKYPADAVEKHIQGRVNVQFFIEMDGTVSNVVALNLVFPSLDKEAVRVISSMPKWKPGTLNGEPQRTYFTIPIQFAL